jgi:predicted dehydrogenase
MNEKIGAAVLGTGDVSGEHIKAYQHHPLTEMRALLTRDRARGEAKAAQYGLANCRIYTSLDDLLKDASIRVVSVCTPHHMHVPQAVACAQSGRHVAVEKPIALDLAGLRKLDEVVRQSGVRTVVSFVLRWNPLFETIRAILAEGTVGDLFYAEVDYFHGIGRSYTGYEWISRKATGGSSLLTGGCHAVDGLRWFIGQDAVEVQAYANWSKGNRLGYEYEPNSVTLVRFADGKIGKVGSSIECVMPYMFNVLLMGNQGTIRNNQLFTSRWPGQTGWATIPTILPDSGAVTHHPFEAEIAHFIDCILSGKESHCNVADAVKTHEICLASEISVREKRPVRLPLPAEIAPCV